MHPFQLGAVERLTVVCAHCNAKLKPKGIDYECQVDKLAVDLRCVRSLPTPGDPSNNSVHTVL